MNIKIMCLYVLFPSPTKTYIPHSFSSKNSHRYLVHHITSSDNSNSTAHMIALGPSFGTGGGGGATTHRPIMLSTATATYIHPGASVPTASTRYVAKAGVDPPTIAWAVLYPNETEVSLASGSNDSVSQAPIGLPQNERQTPRKSWARNAQTGLFPSPMNLRSVGPRRARDVPPMDMMRRRPYLSDSHPAIGKRRHTPIKSEAELMAKACGTGVSVRLDM